MTTADAKKVPDQWNAYNYCISFIDLLGQHDALKGQGLLPIFESEEDHKRFISTLKDSIGAILRLQARAEDTRTTKPYLGLWAERDAQLIFPLFSDARRTHVDRDAGAHEVRERDGSGHATYALTSDDSRPFKRRSIVSSTYKCAPAGSDAVAMTRAAVFNASSSTCAMVSISFTSSRFGWTTTRNASQQGASGASRTR